MWKCLFHFKVSSKGGGRQGSGALKKLWTLVYNTQNHRLQSGVVRSSWGHQCVTVPDGKFWNPQSQSRQLHICVINYKIKKGGGIQRRSTCLQRTNSSASCTSDEPVSSYLIGSPIQKCTSKNNFFKQNQDMYNAQLTSKGLMRQQIYLSHFSSHWGPKAIDKETNKK